ncbi:MAG: MFS transporter [Nitrospirae bacterium]|nr:MFS transporter [Magnetococcales bacterium]HAT50667.1 MFS transporter [Alphaproteobacteria bacterium]
MESRFLSEKQERIFLLTLAGLQFCHILDFMIMMPLGPILMAALKIQTHEFGFLVASYSFCSALSGVLAATLIDRFERKRILLTIFFLFGLATLICGLAEDYTILLFSRGLAGAFGGIMGALVQTMIGDVIPYPRRAEANGIISTAFALATVAGVPLSLWLANNIQWRAPFILTAVLALMLIFLGIRNLPEVRQHLHQKEPSHPFSAMFAVLRNTNHLRALFYSGLIIFSGFTVIPYITIYAVNNVGISPNDIPYVYLCGGMATLFSSRLIGKLADQWGKVRLYRGVALLAMGPLLVVTHIGTVPLSSWLFCTTSFFVLISGRMVPAMTIIVSSAQPVLRGTFMSLNTTVQSLSMGLATLLSGLLITQNVHGAITGYEKIGIIAVLSNLMAIWFVGRIVILDRSG